MLGVADNKNPWMWAESELEELIIKSNVPGHWKKDSIITYRLINQCITGIRKKKLVLKQKLPEICQLLCSSKRQGTLAGILGVKPPLKPQQVHHFIEKVNRKISVGDLDTVVEFPVSKSGDQSSERKSRTQAWVNELGNGYDGDEDTEDEADSYWKSAYEALLKVKLNDEIKSDIERVVSQKVSGLVKLRNLIEGLLLETCEKHKRGEIDGDQYEKAVKEFKEAHQKNSLDDHHCKGQLDIITVCCPHEVENKALEDLVKKKHKRLVMEFYEDLLSTKCSTCDGLLGVDEQYLRTKEKEAIDLVNSVLGIQYGGEADPVDHAHFVKSFLDYVINVVPKHLAKPTQGESSGTSNGTGQKRPSLIGSQRWKNSWEKHFEEAAGDKRKLEEEAELQKRVSGLRSRMEGLDKQLENLQESARLQGLELAGPSNPQIDLRKRQHGAETVEPVQVLRKKRKKKKKGKKVIPIFTGKNIAHLYENQQRVDFFFKDNQKDPGAMTWMEALVLAAKAGQDMSDPENIVYLVKYIELEGIHELKLGQDYLDGNIIIHGESDDDSCEFEDLPLAECKRQAQERMAELRKNLDKTKSKKRPKSNRKTIPDFTGLRLAQCFNEDEDNVPLSSVMKELDENESKSSRSNGSTIRAIRWLEGRVLGPVPNQPNKDPYHTVYRIKYDILSDVYEVDLGKDYLEGHLICSEFSDSEPEPDVLPMSAILKEVTNKIQSSALKRPVNQMQVAEKGTESRDSEPKKKKGSADKNPSETETVVPETPEELARKAEVKKLRKKQEKLDIKERKRRQKHDKRQKEKTKAIKNDAPADTRKQKQKRCDKALRKLLATRQELDDVKKRLVEIGEPEEPEDDFFKNFWTKCYKEEKKKKNQTPAEEKLEKKREERARVMDRLDGLEIEQKKKEMLLKNIRMEVKIAEDIDKRAKKAANIDYWLSSPSKEVKEKQALLDCSREEDHAISKEIDDLYERLSDLNSNVTDTPREKNAKVANLLDFDGLSESDDECSKSKSKNVSGRNNKGKSCSSGAKEADVQEEETGDEEQEDEEEEYEEEVSEEEQKSPEVLEVEEKLSELKTQERRLSSKRVNTMKAITGLKDFERWQTSSKRSNRSGSHNQAAEQSTAQPAAQPTAKPSQALLQKQDVYYETLESLVEVRKQILLLLKKLKEMGETLDSDFSDDDVCEDEWVTKSGLETEKCTAKQQEASPEARQVESREETQEAAHQSQSTEVRDQHESSVIQESGLQISAISVNDVADQHELLVPQENRDTNLEKHAAEDGDQHDTSIVARPDQTLIDKDNTQPCLVHQEVLHKDKNKNGLQEGIKGISIISQILTAFKSKGKCQAEDKMEVDGEQSKEGDTRQVEPDYVGSIDNQTTDHSGQCKEQLGHRLCEENGKQANEAEDNVQVPEINSGVNFSQLLVDCNKKRLEEERLNVEKERLIAEERLKAEKERLKAEKDRLKAEKKRQQKVDRKQRKVEAKKRQEEMEKQKAEEKKIKLAAVDFLDEKIDQVKPIVQHRDVINLHRWDEYLLRKRLEDRVVKTNVDLSSVYPSEEMKKAEELSICASKRAKTASAELKELGKRRNQILFSDLEDEEEESDDDVSSDKESEDDVNGANLDSAEKAKKTEIKELKQKIENFKKTEKIKSNRRKQRWKEVEDEKDFKKWITSSRRRSRRSQQDDDGGNITNSSSEPTKDEIFDLALNALVKARQDIYPLQKRLKELGGEIDIESDWLDDNDDADEEQWITKGASFKEITDLARISEARSVDSEPTSDTTLSTEEADEDSEDNIESNQNDMPSSGTDVTQVGSSEAALTGSQENSGATREILIGRLFKNAVTTSDTSQHYKTSIMEEGSTKCDIKESASISQTALEIGSFAARQDQISDQPNNEKSVIGEKTLNQSSNEPCEEQPHLYPYQVCNETLELVRSDMHSAEDESDILNKGIEHGSNITECETTSHTNKETTDQASSIETTAHLPVNSELYDDTSKSQNSDQQSNEKSVVGEDTTNQNANKTFEVQPHLSLEQVVSDTQELGRINEHNKQNECNELNKGSEKGSSSAGYDTTGHIKKEITKTASTIETDVQPLVNSHLDEDSNKSQVTNMNDDVVILPPVVKHIELVDLEPTSDMELSTEDAEGDLVENMELNQSVMPSSTSADFTHVRNSEMTLTGCQENDGPTKDIVSTPNSRLIENATITSEICHNEEINVIEKGGSIEGAKESASILQTALEIASFAARQDQISEQPNNEKSVIGEKTSNQSSNKPRKEQPDLYPYQVCNETLELVRSDMHSAEDESDILNKGIEHGSSITECETTSHTNKETTDQASSIETTAHLPVNSELYDVTSKSQDVNMEETIDDDVVILPPVVKHIELVDLTEDNKEGQNKQKKMSKEEEQKAKELRKKERAEAKELREKKRAEAKELKEKKRAEAKELKEKQQAEAKVVKAKKRAESDVLDEKMDQLKDIVKRRTMISKHRWDEYELLKRVSIIGVNYWNTLPDTAHNSELKDEIEKAQKLSVIAARRAEAAQKELKALRKERNKIVISDSESSDEEEEDSDEESGSEEEDESEEGSDDASEEEESSDDENIRNGKSNKKSDKKKEARRTELQDKFKKLSSLLSKRRKLKWTYHEEIQELKKSKFAASLVNVIRKKEQLYEGAIKREKDTSEEYDRHWKLMKEELSDYASSEDSDS